MFAPRLAVALLSLCVACAPVAWSEPAPRDAGAEARPYPAPPAPPRGHDCDAACVPASATAAGYVTTGPQALAGDKLFLGGLTLANHQGVLGVDDARANARPVVSYHDYAGWRSVLIGCDLTRPSVDLVLLEATNGTLRTDVQLQDGLLYLSFDGDASYARDHAVYFTAGGVTWRNHYATAGPALLLRGFDGANGDATTPALAGGSVTLTAGPAGADLGGGGAAGGDLLLRAAPGTGDAVGGTATLGAPGTSVVLHTGQTPEAGDLYYVDAEGHLARLPAGDERDVLRIVDGLPQWTAP